MTVDQRYPQEQLSLLLWLTGWFGLGADRQVLHFLVITGSSVAHINTSMPEVSPVESMQSKNMTCSKNREQNFTVTSLQSLTNF